MINQLARIGEFADLARELEIIRATGYSGEFDNIYYDYVYKWAKVLNVCGQLGLLEGEGKSFLEIGGGLSPIQFLLAQHGSVLNLDIQFGGTWFPTSGRFYTRASPEFVAAARAGMRRITDVPGGIESIVQVPAASIDAVIDVCSLHTFLIDDSPGPKRSWIPPEIGRVLRPGGYFISVGDIANPYLGKCDREFHFPEKMLELLEDDSLELLLPADYSWEEELQDPGGLVPRRNVDYSNLSGLNMKYDPASVGYNNVPILPIHIWPATFAFRRRG